jgi:hypothetical protein
MQKNVIADTSLYYQLATNSVQLEDIVARGECLVCSPLSVIEIVTKIDKQSFEYHRAAIKAMVNLRAKTLPIPQDFLANNIFGLKLNRLPYDWLEIIRGIASAANFEEMKLDIIDPTDFKKRTLSIDHTRQWREVIKNLLGKSAGDRAFHKATANVLSGLQKPFEAADVR